VCYVAAPTFKQLADSPHDINATVGETVRFHCNPHAIPEAKIKWYKNGMKIDRMYFCDCYHVSHTM